MNNFLKNLKSKLRGDGRNSDSETDDDYYSHSNYTKHPKQRTTKSKSDRKTDEESVDSNNQDGVQNNRKNSQRKGSIFRSPKLKSKANSQQYESINDKVLAANSLVPHTRDNDIIPLHHSTNFLSLVEVTEAISNDARKLPNQVENSETSIHIPTVPFEITSKDTNLSTNTVANESNDTEKVKVKTLKNNSSENEPCTTDVMTTQHDKAVINDDVIEINLNKNDITHENKSNSPKPVQVAEPSILEVLNLSRGETAKLFKYCIGELREKYKQIEESIRNNDDSILMENLEKLAQTQKVVETQKKISAKKVNADDEVCDREYKSYVSFLVPATMHTEQQEDIPKNKKAKIRTKKKSQYIKDEVTQTKKYKKHKKNTAKPDHFKEPFIGHEAIKQMNDIELENLERIDKTITSKTCSSEEEFSYETIRDQVMTKRNEDDGQLSKSRWKLGKIDKQCRQDNFSKVNEKKMKTTNGEDIDDPDIVPENIGELTVLREHSYKSLMNFDSLFHAEIQARYALQKIHSGHPEERQQKPVIETCSSAFNSPEEHPAKHRGIPEESDDILKLQKLLFDFFGEKEVETAPTGYEEVLERQRQEEDERQRQEETERQRQKEIERQRQEQVELDKQLAEKIVLSETAAAKNIVQISRVEEVDDQQAGSLQIQYRPVESHVLHIGETSHSNLPDVKEDDIETQEQKPVSDTEEPEAIEETLRESITHLVKYAKTKHEKKKADKLHQCLVFYDKVRGRGVKNDIDFVATDPTIYTDNLNLLFPYLCRLHSTKGELQATKSEINNRLLKPTAGLEKEDAVIDCTFEIYRSLADRPFAIACTNKKDLNFSIKLIKDIQKALNAIYKGRDLKQSDERMVELQANGMLSTIERKETGMLYKSENVLVLFNFEEHLRIIVRNKKGDLRKTTCEAYGVLKTCEEKLTAKNISFSMNDTLGYLNPNPVNLGLACKITIHIMLEHYSEIEILENVKALFSVKITQPTKGSQKLYRLESTQQFFTSEVELARNMKECACMLIQIDQRISKGEPYDHLLYNVDR